MPWVLEDLDPVPGESKDGGEEPGGCHHPPCLRHCAHLPETSVSCWWSWWSWWSSWFFIHLGDIVWKSVKNSTDKNSREEIAQKQKFGIFLKKAWNTIESMFDHPLSIKSVYSSILYDKFNSKIQKNITGMLTGQKIAKQGCKNGTHVSARSARSPNYAWWSLWCWWSWWSWGSW